MHDLLSPQQAPAHRQHVALSVVVPVRNEASSLEDLQRGIADSLAGHPGGFEVIYVDDGSTDDSFRVVGRMAERDRRVRGIRLRARSGKSAALAAGFQRAGGTVVATLDADLQDDPSQIPLLLPLLEQGYDLVCGWRRERRDPWARRAASRLFNRSTALLSGLPLHDFNCGLKVLRREVAEEVHLYADLHRFLPVLAARRGFRVGEVPVRHHPRRHGRSNYGWERIGAGIFDLPRVLLLGRYAARPLHLFGLPAVACLGVGGGICLHLAWGRIFADRYLSNRPLLFLGILLLLVGIQFFSLGILGELLVITHAHRLRHPVREEIGFR
jgi:glycosyltransferase involved in cell wall biosynthesis